MWLNRFMSPDFYGTMVLTEPPKKYSQLYEFWVGYLLERCINIFKWKGLPFHEKYLEMYLISIGYCGLSKLDNSNNPYDAIQCSMVGATNYYGEFTTATGTTPISQTTLFQIYGSPKNGAGVERVGIIANNNHTRTPLMPLITYYANLLAHIDLSIQKVCIKMRIDALMKGNSTKHVNAIKEWYENIENGKSIGILDEDTFMELGEGIITKPLGQTSSNELAELVATRTKYLNSFFADIGINSAEEKRERLISNEVTVGFNRVLFNISDMLESRKEVCEQIAAVFDSKVSVELNPNLTAEIVSTQNNERSEEDAKSEE